jgi:hypothetical protein
MGGKRYYECEESLPSVVGGRENNAHYGFFGMALARYWKRKQRNITFFMFCIWVASFRCFKKKITSAAALDVVRYNLHVEGSR